MADAHHPSDAQDDYVRGTQEIGEQAKTFAVFMNMTKWGSLVIAVLVLFLILWFQPGGSLIGGAIGAGALAVAGWFMLKAKKTR